MNSYLSGIKTSLRGSFLSSIFGSLLSQVKSPDERVQVIAAQEEQNAKQQIKELMANIAAQEEQNAIRRELIMAKQAKKFCPLREKWLLDDALFLNEYNAEFNSPIDCPSYAGAADYDTTTIEEGIREIPEDGEEGTNSSYASSTEYGEEGTSSSYASIVEDDSPIFDKEIKQISEDRDTRRPYIRAAEKDILRYNSMVAATEARENIRRSYAIAAKESEENLAELCDPFFVTLDNPIEPQIQAIEEIICKPLSIQETDDLLRHLSTCVEDMKLRSTNSPPLILQHIPILFRKSLELSLRIQS
jgi:hypothetical protein